MTTIYLSLSTQVAISTFFMKSPVVETITFPVTSIILLLAYMVSIWGGGGWSTIYQIFYLSPNFPFNK